MRIETISFNFVHQWNAVQFFFFSRKKLRKNCPNFNLGHNMCFVWGIFTFFSLFFLLKQSELVYFMYDFMYVMCSSLIGCRQQYSHCPCDLWEGSVHLGGREQRSIGSRWPWPKECTHLGWSSQGKINHKVRFLFRQINWILKNS